MSAFESFSDLKTHIILTTFYEAIKAGITLFIQLTVFNCGPDSTAGLVLMAAIGVSTIAGKRDKFLEADKDLNAI